MSGEGCQPPIKGIAMTKTLLTAAALIAGIGIEKVAAFDRNT
jgi:hypothetical protein